MAVPVAALYRRIILKIIVIAPVTLVLTGTAAGVLFKPANIWSQGFYLQAGCVVRTEATYLGHLETQLSGHEKELRQLSIVQA